MSERLSAWLEPIAAWFRSFGMPEPIVHWGHPAMMAIVVLVVGSYVGVTGWRGRVLTATDDAAAAKSRADHKVMAAMMLLFITLGYTGGVLSLVMQQQPILQSPHFWTGSIALALLTANAALSLLFAKGKGFRTIHAYLGSIVLCLLFVHGVLGLKLGLSL